MYARLRAMCACALRLDPRCQDALAPHVRMLGHVYRQAQCFDIIHCHTDYVGLPLTRKTATPTLITMHRRFDLPHIIPLYQEYAEVPLVSISDAQRRPLAGVNWVATVYHGLPPDLYAFELRHGAYVLFLGRISPEKP